ncbi:NAD-dependent succinate-semialdehyde dehydrogenase [Heyndrickxia acidicola]|uniref:NAD-dependent succinate-semialdehyde dehydrogenase n=1 Tax=Heyndrickxia acidicola TaxID=209389 RepID=A0ABU6MCG8_9BACI|nr:NAD-dependent succinate-semialdehyde dehydrogenase [Heyndrickxia acidicola]MED1202354.1 NAD-dependent succinate-semialdehyde dehydrogenase [Heyndrickxia acidicola]
MKINGIKENTIFIDGVWREAAGGKTEAVLNPATLEHIMSFSYGDEKDARLAVQAAKDALPLWSAKTARERSGYLYRAYQLMMERQEDLAVILTTEQGKPLAESRGEIASAASYLLWYAEEANRIYGEMIPSSNKGKRLFTIPQPIGVVAAITPWNFPSSMIARKLGPALAAGCTVVLKPAEQTPLSAVGLVKIFEEAGLPKGVLNLVTGDPASIGKAWLEEQDVRLITFTGSTEVGKHLMRSSADNVKKLSLELGGHAPILVFEDADIDQAVSLSLMSKFRNAGQTCICANRIYVQESIYNHFVKKLVEKVKQLKMGNGLETGIEIGPLIDNHALEKVQSHVQDAINKGASITAGGNRPSLSKNLKGFYYTPTVLTGITDEMLVMKEETFGPVVPIQSFTSEEEAIEKANLTSYGLASYVFTENINRAWRVMEQLEYGIIGINDVFPAAAEAPFGGIKQSGQGKEGGREGMMEYVEMKYISMGLKEAEY